MLRKIPYRRRAAAILTVAVLAALLTSCSKKYVYPGQHTPSDAPRPASTSPAVTLNAAQLKAALPTVADLPTGFTKSTDDGSDDRGGPDPTFGCAQLDAVPSGPDPAAEAHADFDNKNDDSGLTVDLLQRTASEAASDIAAFRSVPAHCPTVTLTALGTQVTLKVASSTSAIGDESAAIQMSADLYGDRFVTRIVVARRAGVELYLTFEGGSDTTLIDRVGKKTVTALDRQH